MELATPKAITRLIGILGGMGPEATLDFYRCIIALTPAHRDQDHLPVIIYSNPKIPDRTRAIAAGGENPLPHLVEAQGFWKNAVQASSLCPAMRSSLPPEMRRMVNIPFLDMIEETSRRLRIGLPAVKAVGLIASIGTVLSGVYARSLSNVGIELVMPDGADQQRIETAIHQVKAGVHNRSIQDTFQSIGLQLIKAGAEAVILGCTEIPLAFDGHEVDYPSLNATKILAEAAVIGHSGEENEP